MHFLLKLAPFVIGLAVNDYLRKC